MTEIIYKILFWLGILSTIPVVIFYMICYRSLTAPLKALFILTIVSVTCDGLSLIVARTIGNTHIIFHIYNVLEATLFLIFYYLIFKIKIFKNLIWIGAGIIFLSLIFSLTEPNAYLFVNDIVSFIQGLVISIFALLFYFQILKFLEEPLLKNDYLFWMNTAILIYSLLPIFVFLFYRLIASNNKPNYFWIIFMFASFLFHTLQFIGLWKFKKKLI